MEHHFRQLLQMGAFCIKDFIKGAESIQYIYDTPLDLWRLSLLHFSAKVWYAGHLQNVIRTHLCGPITIGT